MEFKYVYLIDGECIMCNNLSRFVSAFDINSRIRFYPLQGIQSSRVLDKIGYKNQDFDTSILLLEDRYFDKSTAFFELCSELKYPLKLLYFIKPFGKFGGDLFYDILGRFRYKLFCRQDKICSIRNTTSIDLILCDSEMKYFLDKYSW